MAYIAHQWRLGRWILEVSQLPRRKNRALLISDDGGATSRILAYFQSDADQLLFRAALENILEKKWKRNLKKRK